MTGSDPKSRFKVPFFWQGHPMPAVWETLIPEEILAGFAPSERDATCNRCPKVVTCSYDAEMRCCTYMPRVPNFALGLALLHGGETAEAVRRVIRAGWVTPEGFHETPAIWLKSLQQWREEAFGKSADVVCPFLDRSKQACGIHPFRNSVCATFFCRNDHGRLGKEFWERLEDLGVQSEAALCQWTMDRNGFPVEAYFETLGSLAEASLMNLCDQATGAWKPEVLERLWNGRLATAESYLIQCAEDVIENADGLFERALETKLRIPSRFERAMIDQVPAELKPYIPSDRLAEGQPAGIDDLVYKAKLAQRNLNLLPEPGTLIQINPDVTLQENQQTTSLDRHYGDYPGRICWHSRDVDDDWFLTAAERDALRDLGKEPRRCDDKLFARWQSYGIDIPQRFLSKALGKGVVETITEH